MRFPEPRSRCSASAGLGGAQEAACSGDSVGQSGRSVLGPGPRGLARPLHVAGGEGLCGPPRAASRATPNGLLSLSH